MKRGYTLVEFLIVVSIVGVLAAILVPAFKTTGGCGQAVCPSNLQQIYMANRMYADDCKRLPPLEKPHGWIDALEKERYIKSRQILYCPQNEIERPENVREPNFTDYYLNRNLARLNPDYILKPGSVLLVGEGNDGRDLSNASYSRVNVPENWAADSNSPLLRHKPEEPGAFYVFLDGHAKYLEGTAINFGFRHAAKPKK